VPSPAQALLDPELHPKFVNPLPVPSVIDARNGGVFTINISQFDQSLGLADPVSGQPMLTKVWGYNGSYPGPTILAKKDVPVEVFWRNNLVDANNIPLPHLLPIDPSVHWAFNGITNWQSLGVPVTTHLHGGRTESASDGLPDSWFTPGFTL
jgi:spore coat protein A